MKRTPLAQRSQKAKALDGRRSKVRAQKLREHERCECCRTRPTQDIHERLTRARAGGTTANDGAAILTLENLIGFCRLCHDYWTVHTKAAEERGIILPSSWGMPTEAWEGEDYLCPCAPA